MESLKGRKPRVFSVEFKQGRRGGCWPARAPPR